MATRGIQFHVVDSFQSICFSLSQVGGYLRHPVSCRENLSERLFFPESRWGCLPSDTGYAKDRLLLEVVKRSTRVKYNNQSQSFGQNLRC